MRVRTGSETPASRAFADAIKRDVDAVLPS